jgi:hypothetical protein
MIDPIHSIHHRGITLAKCGFGSFSVYLFWLIWIHFTVDFIICTDLNSFCVGMDSCFGDGISHNDSISDQDFTNVAQAIHGGIAFGPFLNYAIDGVIDSLGWSQGIDLDTDLAGPC